MGSTPWDILILFMNKFIFGVSEKKTDAIAISNTTIIEPKIVEPTITTRNYALLMFVQEYIGLPFESTQANMLLTTIIVQLCVAIAYLWNWNRKRIKTNSDPGTKQHESEEKIEKPDPSAPPFETKEEKPSPFKQLNDQLANMRHNDLLTTYFNSISKNTNQLLKFTKEQSITQWLKKVENFCNTNNITDKFDTVMRHLDNECLEIVNEYKLIKPIIDFDSLRTAIIEIFKQEEVSTVNEIIFNNRKQQPNESPTLFYIELNKLAEQAFPELKDEAKKKRTMNQFIANLEDSRISHALMLEPITSIEKVIEKINTIKRNFIEFNTVKSETVPMTLLNSYQSQQQPSYQSNNPNKYNTVQNQFNNNYRRERSNSFSANSNQQFNQRRPRPNECSICYQTGHWASDCPQKQRSRSNYRQQAQNNYQQQNNFQPQYNNNNTQPTNYGRIVSPEQQSSAFAMKAINNNQQQLQQQNQPKVNQNTSNAQTNQLKPTNDKVASNAESLIDLNNNNQTTSQSSPNYTTQTSNFQSTLKPFSPSLNNQQQYKFPSINNNNTLNSTTNNNTAHATMINSLFSNENQFNNEELNHSFEE